MPASALILGLLCLLVATSSPAQSVRVFRDGASPEQGYAGTRDISLDRSGSRPWNPSANYDVLDPWASGTANQVALMRWDLSALSATTSVESVELELVVVNGSPDSYALLEALRPWKVEEATWNEYATGATWSSPGAAATGSDRGATALAIITGSSGRLRFPLNADGVALVQSWVAGTRPNNGFLVAHSTSTDSISWTGSESAMAANRPLLRVVHSGGQVAEFRTGVAPTTAYAGGDETTIASGENPRRQLRLDGGGTPNSAVLLRFDLGALGSAGDVEGASLEFTALNGSSSTFNIHPMYRAWTEEGADYERADGVTLWESPGATGTSERGMSTLGQVQATGAGRIQVPLNQDGVALIQSWIDGAENHGFWIGDFAQTDALVLADRESENVLDRPALILTVRTEGGDGGTQGNSPLASVSPSETTLAAGTRLVLDGSASRPSAGASSLERWEWTQVRGPTGVALEEDGLDRASVTLFVPGSYVFSLVVHDAGGRSQAAFAQVNVLGEKDLREGPLGGCGAAHASGALAPLVLLAAWLTRIRRSPTV